MEKCFKLNAAKKFFDILSGSEFVAFLGYRNEVFWNCDYGVIVLVFERCCLVFSRIHESVLSKGLNFVRKRNGAVIVA